jgi:hypothetical protein
MWRNQGEGLVDPLGPIKAGPIVGGGARDANAGDADTKADEAILVETEGD